MSKSYHDLIQKVSEDAAAGTVSSNISYLPSGFTSTKNMIRSLAPVKTTWGVDIIEDKEMYTINFENELKFDVPRKYYEHFNKHVLKVDGLKEVDIAEMVNEAKQEDLSLIYNDIKGLLKDLVKKGLIKTAYGNFLYFKQLFKLTGIEDNNKAIFQSFLTFESGKDIIGIVKKLQDQYGDDLGSLQILQYRLEEGLPINDIKPFDEYDFLFNNRYVGEFNGVKVYYELSVNLAMIMAESVLIDTEEVAEELAPLKGIKVVKNTIYPVGKFFEPTFFKRLRDECKDFEPELKVKNKEDLVAKPGTPA